jgi:VacB/RNase II family 3'-5' exoribonuclease
MWREAQFGYFIFKSRRLRFQLLRTFDKRIPWIKVPTQLLTQFSDQDLKYNAFKVHLSGWDSSSASPYTEREVQLVGSKVDQAILEKISVSIHKLEHLFKHFADRSTPQLDERVSRLDLTDRIAVSIDPPNAHEIDDALHCITLEGGGFEVGVHIADIWAFLTPNSDADQIARSRHQTLYLSRQTYPIFPRSILRLASLTPHQSQPVLSVIFTFDEHRNLIKHEIKRSVIRLRQQLTYDMADALVRGEDHPELNLTSRETATYSNMLCDLRSLAQVLRDQRTHVSLFRPNLSWEEDQQGRSISFNISSKLWSHFMVEEWMLSANHALAKCALHSDYGALLRIHERSYSGNFEALKRPLMDILYSHNLSSHTLESQQLDHELHHQLARLSYPSIIDEDHKPNEELLGASAGVMITMSSARYTYTRSQSEMTSHLGVGLHPYAHGTSPLRRYADVILHAQVISTLTQDQQTSGLDTYLATLDPKIDHKLTRTSTAMRHQREWQRAPSLAIHLFSTRRSMTLKAVICGLTQQSVMIGFYELGIYRQIKRPTHLDLELLQRWNVHVSSKHQEVTELDVELISRCS